MRRAAVMLLSLLPALLLPALAGAMSLRTQHHAETKKPAGYLFSADEVRFDQGLGLIVARGHVEISQDDEILLADTVTYNQHTDTATASGHVSLMEADGTVTFADYAELRDNFKNGFVRDVRMLLSDRSRLAGNTARRVNGTRMEIRRGVYSPCDLCKDDPTRAPVWQVRAERIVDDKELKRIEYYDAEMQIDGVPVLWMPYFSSPDPSVRRASGFLAPAVGYNSNLGFHLETPYYWAISPDKDMTLTPLITSGAGVLLMDEYRERFANGMIDLQGSVAFGTPPTDISTQGIEVDHGAQDVRWNVFGKGEFDLTDDWRATFNVERASDITYLLRYGLASGQDYLPTYGTLEYFHPDSYANISAMGYQTLLPGINAAAMPFALPVADYMWVTQPDLVGGQLILGGNALDLINPNGISERRLSSSAVYRRPFDGLIGDRFELMVSGRADGYYSTDLPNLAAGPTATQDAFAGRFFPQAALTWRYPWARHGGRFTEVIEPVVMAVAGPNTGNFSKIPNVDSQAFEFDDTDLFVPNRFSGYDLVDTGQRVDYGLRGGIYGDNGKSMRFLVGQSYAFETDPAFLPGSGLTRRLSDVVGRIVVTPLTDLNFIYRFRVDGDDLAMRVQEIAAQLGPPKLNLRLSYTQLSALASYPEQVSRTEVGAALSFAINDHWSADVQEIYDFSNAANILSGLGVTYRDECLSVTGSIGQSGIQIGDVKPGVSVLLTFVFKNLGEYGLSVASFQE